MGWNPQPDGIIINYPRWWFQAIFFIFTPNFGEDEPILTSIFFRWVGSTTNQVSLYHLRTQTANEYNESRIREGEEQMFESILVWLQGFGMVRSYLCLDLFKVMFYFLPQFGRIFLELFPGSFTANPSMAYQFCGCKSQRRNTHWDDGKGLIGTTLVEGEPLSQCPREGLTSGSS